VFYSKVIARVSLVFGSFMGIIYARDRYNIFKEESINLEQIKKTITDEEINKLRELDKNKYINISDDEFKVHLGKLIKENESRENMLKTLERVRKENER